MGVKKYEFSEYDELIITYVSELVFNKGKFIKIVSPSENYVANSYMSDEIMELFAENNIDIAFNQLDIFIKNKDTGEEIPFIDVAKLAQNH